MSTILITRQYLLLATSTSPVIKRQLFQQVRLASTTTVIKPLDKYNDLVKIGKLRDDKYQRGIIASLETLHSELCKYTPPDVPKPDVNDLKPKKGLAKLFGSIFKSNKGKQNNDSDNIAKVPDGIYLYGDVGCGKTMLMDLFYDTIPPHLHKQRMHFHQFMQNLHKRSHQLKMEHGGYDVDVIPLLAWELTENATVLCFDEFQVTDVADAMLLRRLLDILLAPDHGVILFATSNRAPDDLYINGIQRDNFIPCIQLMKKLCNVIYLNSPTDYRKIPRPISSVYYTPPPGVSFQSKTSREQQKRHIETWYNYFSQGHPKEHNIPLKIWGRELIVPQCTPQYVAQFTFEELCGQPLAAGDYLTLASSFQSIIVTDIPYLSVDVRDKVRRFITFLDAIYDNQGRIAVTAVAPFTDIFVEPELLANGDFELIKKTDEEIEEHYEQDDLVTLHGFDKKVAQKAAMFGNMDEEKFAFARALSRLSHMSTQDWVENARLPEHR
ncbi:unnamed protein product [Ambrosiozyma monospora]|uniref:Unnamed protein product n=1 Tax=Ambrosiozyma monospora TaxID=43982 RepID=A0ACB5TAY8_AMBMO|nr:unnamed protein product [Ambrosiozyma monospora]